MVLLAGALCTLISLIGPETDGKLISSISNNWLVIIFKLHANIIDPGADPLKGVNLYDIFILSLFIFLCLCLYLTFKKQKKIWFLTAITLLILGIVMFIITDLSGRSSFMASGIVISLILVFGGFHKEFTGITGILANTLLLFGDFTVGANLKSVPFIFGLGYILLIIWIFMLTLIFIRTKPGQDAGYITTGKPAFDLPDTRMEQS